MDTVRTVVIFKSAAFNFSEPRDYFINPCCYGDDVARWLAEQLHCKGYQADDVPGQEDFGWYITFRVSDISYCFVIGHRPGDENTEGEWIGWVERSRGFTALIFGGRNRGIQPAAAQVIHEILSNSRKIRDIHWHLLRDFRAGREDLGTSAP